MIDYKALTNKMEKGVWYSSNNLTILWNIPAAVRKARVQALTKKGLIETKGKTAAIRYRLAEKKIKVKTGTVKLTFPTPLESLIEATEKVGTENAIMKKALREAKAIIDKALEATT